MLYGLVVAVHVIACLILILVILLQAGRGGGISEAFGGGAAQSLFGTKTNVFLTRATTISAILFVFTCLILNIMTSRMGKSLIELEKFKQAINTQMPVNASANEKTTVNETQEELPKPAPGTTAPAK